MTVAIRYRRAVQSGPNALNSQSRFAHPSLALHKMGRTIPVPNDEVMFWRLRSRCKASSSRWARR